jgi:hypothetical protein
VKLGKLDAQALALDGEEQAATQPSPLADPGVRRALLGELGAIAKRWRKAKPEAKREIVGHLAKTVAIAAGFTMTIAFTWRSAEELAEEST